KGYREISLISLQLVHLRVSVSRCLLLHLLLRCRLIVHAKQLGCRHASKLLPQVPTILSGQRRGFLKLTTVRNHVAIASDEQATLITNTIDGEPQWFSRITLSQEFTLRFTELFQCLIT